MSGPRQHDQGAKHDEPDTQARRARHAELGSSHLLAGQHPAQRVRIAGQLRSAARMKPGMSRTHCARTLASKFT